MKHRVSGRKLGRTSAHRLAVLRNLSTDLFERERIRTTLMKAKELRPFAERLITLSKNGSLHARRQAAQQITRPRVVQKLFDTISARYAERPGGYTRILKLGPRRGDNAEMAILELIGSELKPSTPSGDGGEQKQKRVLGRLRDRLTRGKQAPGGGEAAAGAKGDGGSAAAGAGSPGAGAGRQKRSSQSSRPVKGDNRAGGRKGGSKKPSGD